MSDGGSTSPPAKTIACRLFDDTGKYETEWARPARPSARCLAKGRCPYCYIGECGPTYGFSPQTRQSRPTCLRRQPPGRQILARLATAHRTISPARSPRHTASRLTSRGAIYVGEVAKTGWATCFPGVTPDKPRAGAAETCEGGMNPPPPSTRPFPSLMPGPRARQRPTRGQASTRIHAYVHDVEGSP